METKVFETKQQMGVEAAGKAAEKINKALKEKGEANIILATGASQFETLKNLVKADIDWSKVNMFHLDEYIGIDNTHPASFCKYLKERFVDKVGKLKSVNFVNGSTDDPQKECERLNEIISKVTIDTALVGVGENGHLAFNDPPADFETEKPFIVVKLDEKCRQQQLGEGWFKSLDKVPQKAISMSINQIIKSNSIIVSVPDKRKAQALKGVIEGEITNQCPASILQKHPDCCIYMDKPAAQLLN
jgi:glucosamine-6-phosphate deaminase